MNPSSDKPEKTPVNYAALGSSALTVGGEVGCLTLIIVLGSVIGGLWLDNLLGTKPMLTIFLVVASAPVSLGLTFWLAKRAVANMTPAKTHGKEFRGEEGDTTGE
jgi:hypothetical protein